MRKFHKDDDAFLAIGGPAHGQLLQHYPGSNQTYLFIAPPPERMWEPVSAAEALEPLRYETYRLWTAREGPREMMYFVHEGLGLREIARLIEEVEREEPEVGRR